MNFQWEKADEYSNCFWETSHFSNSEIKSKQEYFNSKYKCRLYNRYGNKSKT